MFYSSYCNSIHISITHIICDYFNEKCKKNSVFTHRYVASVINMLSVRYSKIDPGMWSSWNKNAFLDMESTSSGLLVAGFRFFLVRSFDIKKM